MKCTTISTIKHKSKGVQIDSNECDFKSTGDDVHRLYAESIEIGAKTDKK